jgi:hypothetical protein
MARQHRVVTNTPGTRTRLLFEGNEADARTYVQNNFPAAHVEPPSQDPGIPDVKLVHPTGKVETYHKHGGWSDGDGHPKEEVESDYSDADSEVE